MEQYSQNLMWVKNKYVRNSHFRASMINTLDNSWDEEQAFFNDANGAGPLGGSVWPPRCYSCGFCKREFGSAQALGGHMNVHRRDRARLKQSLESPQTHQVLRSQSHSHHPCKSFAHILSYPSQVGERQKELSQYSSPPSCLDPKGVGLLTVLSVSDYKSASGAGEEEFAFLQNGENCVERSLTRGFDLIDSPNRPVPLFLNQYSNDGYSLEDLDLELRLGDPPKVK